MKKNLLLLFITLSILSSCKKEDTINDIFGWKNTNSSASGLRNGKKWEASRISMFGLDGNISLDLTEYNQDSIIISNLSIANIPPFNGTYKINQGTSFSKEVYSFFNYGYDDQFFTYKPDTLQNNTIQITEFDLDKGVIKGKINGTYTYFVDKQYDFIFKDLEFTYLR